MTSGGTARLPQKALPMNASHSGRFTLQSLLVIPVILLVLLLLPRHGACAQITIDSDEQFRFAEQTMDEGEYLRAVVEFERFLRFFPEDKRVSKAKLASRPSAI